MFFPLETDLGEGKGNCYLSTSSQQDQLENEDRKGLLWKNLGVIFLLHAKDLSTFYTELKEKQSLEKYFLKI